MRRVVQEESWLDREACYRALELCRVAMVGRGQRRLDFSDWFRSELGPMLRADLAEDAPVAMRAMQVRAIQVVQAYSTSMNAEEFGVAFEAVARLIAARDLANVLSIIVLQDDSFVDQDCLAQNIEQLLAGHLDDLEKADVRRVSFIVASELSECNGASVGEKEDRRQTGEERSEAMDALVAFEIENEEDEERKLRSKMASPKPTKAPKRQSNGGFTSQSTPPRQYERPWTADGERLILTFIYTLNNGCPFSKSYATITATA